MAASPSVTSKPKRIVALSGLVLLLAIFGIAWSQGGADVSEGDRAILATGSLRRGMTLPEALGILHPERMREANSVTYGLRPTKTGAYEVDHALTSTRYVHLVFAGSPPRTPSRPSGLESLESWRLSEGILPHEDVTIERVLRIGSYRIRY